VTQEISLLGAANVPQAFLKIAGIQHRLLSSNNHASPTGVLPFLLPAFHGPQASQESPLPVPSNKLVKFASENGSTVKEPPSMRYEAYQSLLDHRIRNAWVCPMLQCLIGPTNYVSALQPLPRSPQFLLRRPSPLRPTHFE
jgi:metaxin